MKGLIKAVTLIAGAAAVAGMALQRREAFLYKGSNGIGKIKVLGTKQGPVAVYVSGQVPPDGTPVRMRKIGSAVCTRGSEYLFRHRNRK